MMPRFARPLFLLVAASTFTMTALAADTFAGPTDAKAQKTFNEAQQKQKDPKGAPALDLIDMYKKADKQDGHQCAACAEQVVVLGFKVHDYKLATEYAGQLLGLSHTPEQEALAHAYKGIAELKQAQLDHKQALYTAADQDLKASLVSRPNDSTCLFCDGVALANLMQDEEAKQRFAAYTKVARPDSVEAKRAQRYVTEPQLARARMAPPFEVTTIDGKRISLDDLQGKVVLIDFWATWCPSCIEALPTIQHIAQKFAGQPLVIISISLDSDEAKWKKFVETHNMTWVQARDGGWNGPVGQLFGVRAIPHTFSIDADGVLQDEKVGDAGIEGKLRKLVAQAQQEKRPSSEEARVPGQ